MFTKDELNFLLIAVNEVPIVDTQTAKNKAFMLGKIAELMDMPEPMPKPELEIPIEEPAKKKVTKKKAASKK